MEEVAMTEADRLELLSRIKDRIDKSAIRVSTVKAPHTYMKAVGTHKIMEIIEEELKK